MNYYSKTLLSVLLASATVLFIWGVGIGPAIVAAQDEAGEEYSEMTEEEYEAYMIEYEAWEAADKEPDIVKSGAMLIEFIQKNPASTLAPFAEGSYQRLLARCIEEKRYQELLTLAEQWNSFRPGDENIIRMIAVSARELKNTEKYLWALEDMNRRDPQMDLAREIASIYREMGNDAKWIEWSETILRAPEEASNFLLHYDLFRYYVDRNDTARIMEYAQSTLKAMEQVRSPSPEIAALLPDIRHELNHNIGVMHFTAKRYDDAIAYFMRALQDKRYANGYFLIGNSLWEQNRILNARMAFAKAQLFGESAEANEEDRAIAPRARESMERLHRALHNNTLVGIERRYQQAREMSDEDLLRPMQ
jgi:tetratricopeptide (TPR) repeat protein